MFYDIYCSLCKERGISPSAAAIEMGINKGTVSVWKNRGVTPQAQQLQKISSFFGVSIDYLLGNEEKLPAAECDEELAEMLEDIRRNPELRAMFDLAKGSTAEEVRTYTNVIRALKEGNGHG